MNDQTLEALTTISKRSAKLSVLGLIIIMCSLGYSAYKLSTIELQLSHKKIELEKLEAAIKHKDEDLSEKNSVLVSLNNQIEIAVHKLNTVKSYIDRLPASSEYLADLRNSFIELDSEMGVIDIDAQSSISTETSHKKKDYVMNFAPMPMEDKKIKEAIQGLFDSSALVRSRSYAAFMKDYGNESRMIYSLLEYATNHKDNLNGIYNTLVVLNNTDLKNVDKKYITDFAESVRANGEKTSQRVDVLLSRIKQ